MLAQPQPDIPGEPNHPLAPRMAIIAIISQNFMLGPIFGSFGVMLGPEVQRLGVSTAQAALAISVVFISSSLLASSIGALLSRFSLRWMLLLGAFMAMAAFALLALTASYALYLLAYTLLLGPVMALGLIGPSTLVTRWFKTHGGLVQGLVYLPIMVTIMPLLTNWTLQRFGVQSTYLLMAAMIGVILVPLLLLVIDVPPGQHVPVLGKHVAREGSLTERELLSQPRFWAFALAVGATTGSSTALNVNLIPMAASWHIDRSSAAMLITLLSAGGMAGSVLFGWLADRIGGRWVMVILTLSSAVIWLALAQSLPFLMAAVVIALYGLFSGGVIPNFSRAIAETYGAATYSRGLGLAMTVGLPLNVLIVPMFPWIRSQTGSNLPAMFGIAGLLVTAFLLTLFAARRPVLVRAAEALN